MQNSTVIIILTILMNTLGGITTASLFKPGSTAFIAISIASLVVGNALAIFGKPVTQKNLKLPANLDGIETPKV